jgi:hypothetical protein
MKRLLGVLLSMLFLAGCVPAAAPAPDTAQTSVEDPKYGALRLEVTEDANLELRWGVSVRVDDVDPVYEISEGGHVTVVLPVGIHKISGTLGGWHDLGGYGIGPFPISDHVTLTEAGTTWRPM